MKLVIGSNLGGPENCGSPVDRAITLTSANAESICAETSAEGFEINLVFFLPGSIASPDWSGCRTGTYFRKSQTLVIQAAVPTEVTISTAPLGALVLLMHDAVNLAVECLRRKKIDFPAGEAHRIIYEAARLAGQQLAAQGLPQGPLPEHNQSRVLADDDSRSRGKSTHPRRSRRRHQLVLQWPAESIVDYDMMIAIEEELLRRLPKRHVVDGHDYGSGTANIFIHTTDAQAAFAKVKELFEGRGAWKHLRAAFRDEEGDEFTPLWPEGLESFEVM